MSHIITFNPANEEKLNEYTLLNKSEISDKINKTYKTFLNWRLIPIQQRLDFVQKLATKLLENKNDYAKLMALEMGKPIKQGVAEIEKCAWLCDYYFNNAENFLKDELIKTEFQKSYITFQPLGVILSIMPWNFPFWQVFRFAIPAIIAGNAVLLKHSPNTMGCAFEIEKLFSEAEFPENVFTNLCIDIKFVEDIIKNEKVSAVTFTGSTTVGSIIARQAGENLKKCVLELGGSDPYVILEDAELNNAVDACIIAKMINSGQSCIAAKRFIVIESIADKFADLFTKKMSAFTLGNPLDENTTCGPIARKDLLLNLHRQVLDAKRKGAKVLLGGELIEQKGFFYPPTVLVEVKSDMLVAEEEVFGPVATIIKVKNEAEAIELANNTSFGLGAAIFTKDLEKAEYLAKYELNAGSVFINSFVRSDPRLPFGGIKKSGFGRELSEYGIKEFVNIKTICK